MTKADNKIRPSLSKISSVPLIGKRIPMKLGDRRQSERTRLQDKAPFWYQGLATDVYANWASLEAAFLIQFALAAPKEVDPTWFLNLALNLKQRVAAL